MQINKIDTIMIVLRNKSFSDKEKSKKDKQFEKDLKKLEEKRSKATSIVLSPYSNIMKGNVVNSTLLGAAYGATGGAIGAGLVNGGLATAGAIKALKKGLPVKKYTKKYITLFNKRKGNGTAIDFMKEEARHHALTMGGISLASKVGRMSSEKYDDFVEKRGDILDVQDGKMSKEDFIKKHYGKEYLKKIKDDNSEK